MGYSRRRDSREPCYGFLARRDRRGHTRELILDGTGGRRKRGDVGAVRFPASLRPEPVEGYHKTAGRKLGLMDWVCFQFAHSECENLSSGGL